MAIEFDCGQCGKPLFAQDQFAGRPIKCPGCGHTFNIPGPSQATTGSKEVRGGIGETPQAPPDPRVVPPSSLSVSDMTTVAFQAFSKNLWLGAGLNMFVLIWKLAALGLVLFFLQANTWQEHLRPTYLATLLFLWAIDSMLWSGLMWVGVKMADQAIGVPVPPTAADFFAPFSRPMAILGAWLPYMVCLEVAKILCVTFLPGTSSTSALISFGILMSVNAFYYTRLYMAVPLILDRNLGAIDALRESMHITRGHSFVVLGVLVISAVSYLVGAFLCIIGVIFTSTYGVCMTGALYRNLTAQK